MGERKVINKYYPPDFDPSLLPRRKRPKDNQQKVRVMLPMTICCNTCHEFIYRGKKFNSRKETVEGEDYLGIKIYRFYIKCTKCSAEITFKTDPKHSDYQAEFGATRNYEPMSWRQQEEDARERLKKKEKDEGDAIAQLEARTAKKKQEMDAIETLDELKALSGRQEHVAVEDILAARRQAESAAEQADEEELASVVFHKPTPAPALASVENISRLSKGVTKLPKKLPSKKKNTTSSSLHVIPKAKPEEPEPTSALASLFGSYGE